jgi:hypothetical protein
MCRSGRHLHGTQGTDGERPRRAQARPAPDRGKRIAVTGSAIEIPYTQDQLIQAMHKYGLYLDGTYLPGDNDQ